MQGGGSPPCQVERGLATPCEITQDLAILTGRVLQSTHHDDDISHLRRDSLVMRRLASKVVKAMRRARGRQILDPSTLHAPMSPVEPDVSGLAPGHAAWLRAIAGMADLAWPLLQLRELRKLAERIDKSEAIYMPGGPPMSPVTDSFHLLWAMADTQVGLDRETLCSIVIDLARKHGAPANMLQAWQTIANSYPGLYTVVERQDSLVELQELVTDERSWVQLSDDIWGPPGCLWWTRLLPAPSPDSHVTSVDTPYVFPDSRAAAEWLDYLDRALVDSRATDRESAYRRFMKRGPTPPFGWLDYILDAYDGVQSNAVALAGVPDRPGPRPDGSGKGTARSPMSAAERTRVRLLDRARERGLLARAKEHFGDLRDVRGLPRELAPEEHGQMTMTLAYAMFGVPDPDGHTALEQVLAESMEGDPVHDHLVALSKGWFSLFEVVGIEIDVGLQLRDVLRRRRLEVRERLATRQLSLGDLVAGWVMVEGDVNQLEGAVLQVPRMWAKGAIEETRTAIAELRRRRGMSWRARQARMAPFVAALVASLDQREWPMQLCNHDGHRLLISQAEYHLVDIRRALNDIRALPDICEVGPHEFIWSSSDQEVVFARIYIDGPHLVLETNSRERLQAAREQLEAATAAALAHLGDRFADPRSTGTEEALDDDGVATQDDVPEQVMRAAAAMLQQRLMSWVDTRIPALGDKTPRQIARSRDGRHRVAAMLMEQERMLRRGDLGDTLDYSLMWRALDMEYPGPFDAPRPASPRTRSS